MSAAFCVRKSCWKMRPRSSSGQLRVRSARQFDDRLLAVVAALHLEFDLMRRPALERGVDRRPTGAALISSHSPGLVSAVVVLAP